MDQLIGEVGADHEEGSLGEIEHPEQPEDEAQSGGEEEIAGCIGEPVEKEVEIDMTRYGGDCNKAHYPKNMVFLKFIAEWINAQTAKYFPMISLSSFSSSKLP
jgi:hypothetical protein